MHRDLTNDLVATVFFNGHVSLVKRLLVEDDEPIVGWAPGAPGAPGTPTRHLPHRTARLGGTFNPIQTNDATLLAQRSATPGWVSAAGLQGASQVFDLLGFSTRNALTGGSSDGFAEWRTAGHSGSL